MPVILSEAEFTDEHSINGRELRAITETARVMGFRVIQLPRDLESIGGAEAVFAWTPRFDPPEAGIWAGYIPAPGHYEEVYRAAAERGIRLINDPEEHMRAMDFDGFYGRLDGMTPESRRSDSVDAAVEAAEELGYPVFVKGAVKSSKEAGWKACVAENESELRGISTFLMSRPGRSRGRIIVRRLATLRRTGEAPGGFPLSREYRVFLLRNEVISFGYYWEGTDDPWPLTEEDRKNLFHIVGKASLRLEVPFVAVDAAQLESGEWIIIEAGDAQFCGLSQASMLGIWNRLGSDGGWNGNAQRA
jgi:hypothetical protein